MTIESAYWFKSCLAGNGKTNYAYADSLVKCRTFGFELDQKSIWRANYIVNYCG